jgi:hypothetical protein
MNKSVWTDRLIDEARRNIDAVNGRSHTEWKRKNGEDKSREYKLGFANWRHYGKEAAPEWCTDIVSLTLKVFADGKERKIFSINNFGASRKHCEALIVSKAVWKQGF